MIAPAMAANSRPPWVAKPGQGIVCCRARPSADMTAPADDFSFKVQPLNRNLDRAHPEAQRETTSSPAAADRTQNDKIRPACNSFHTKRDRRGAGAFIHCVMPGNIASRQMQRQVIHFQSHHIGGAKVVDRRVAGPERLRLPPSLRPVFVPTHPAAPPRACRQTTPVRALLHRQACGRRYQPSGQRCRAMHRLPDVRAASNKLPTAS
jgi:hypothetical protein